MINDDDIIARGRPSKRLSAIRVSAMSDKPYKPVKVVDEKHLEICLNCDKPKCSGYCKKIKGDAQ